MNALIIRYLGRAIVAIPFVIAAAFGIAALTLALIDEFGTKRAYLIEAVLFAVVGALGAIIVNVKEQEEERPAVTASEPESDSNPLDVAEKALAPTASLLIPMLANPTGISMSAGILRWAMRNAPLIVLAVVIAVLQWPVEGKEERSPEAEAAAARAAAEADARAEAEAEAILAREAELRQAA